MATRQKCEGGCGRWAKGGHRFCYTCLGTILNTPSEAPRLRETGVFYRIPRRKKGKSNA